MCQSYRKDCACGKNTAEIFFGKMVLDEQSVEQVYCPQCSQNVETNSDNRVWDNGWVLELDMDVVRTHAVTMGISSHEITADWVFDAGFATWVGIIPDDYKKKQQERAEILKLAKTDLLAYYQAMKEWGLSREKRFTQEGWRKMKVHI
ncbi:MAG: hypothetical protein JSU83_17580 [Deltaproteobacteria bacterium]|nr:MAG: hypothetical protein JSU83_17580 [Deltaproteobacteria bacterium]